MERGRSRNTPAAAYLSDAGAPAKQRAAPRKGVRFSSKTHESKLFLFDSAWSCSAVRLYVMENCIRIALFWWVPEYQLFLSNWLNFHFSSRGRVFIIQAPADQQGDVRLLLVRHIGIGSLIILLFTARFCLVRFRFFILLLLTKHFESLTHLSFWAW